VVDEVLRWEKRLFTNNSSGRVWFFFTALAVASLRNLGDSLISNMPRKYILVGNNCQTFVIKLWSKIAHGVVDSRKELQVHAVAASQLALGVCILL
jgi:hypothetical protein